MSCGLKALLYSPDHYTALISPFGKKKFNLYIFKSFVFIRYTSLKILLGLWYRVKVVHTINSSRGTALLTLIMGHGVGHSLLTLIMGHGVGHSPTYSHHGARRGAQPYLPSSRGTAWGTALLTLIMGHGVGHSPTYPHHGARRGAQPYLPSSWSTAWGTALLTLIMGYGVGGGDGGGAQPYLPLS